MAQSQRQVIGKRCLPQKATGSVLTPRPPKTPPPNWQPPADDLSDYLSVEEAEAAHTPSVSKTTPLAILPIQRGGWFTKAQSLVAAVLDEDWQRARDLVENFYK